MMRYLLQGDCAEKMRDLAPNSVDAIVTDPPYGLAFMGANWDYGVPGEMFWREALRVAKPGAHLLAFGGTRTYHRLACAIEDAGWEVRDCIMWVYSSGFPKSMNIAKAIDKSNGYCGEIIGERVVDASMKNGNLLRGDHRPLMQKQKVYSLSRKASVWDGWGTCLKPAYEPIVIARKPIEKTVVANVLKHGTGAINIDACRVPTAESWKHGATATNPRGEFGGNWKRIEQASNKRGRFPANLIHDGSPEVLAAFPDSKGQRGAIQGNEPSELTRGIYGRFSGNRLPCSPRNDAGSAARFFYCAKPSRSERGSFNDHVTVKPLALMRYLVRLVTRKGGIVLDPFMGSGTTGVAAIQEGMNFVGIERDPHYYEIASRRVNDAKPIPPTTTQEELPI